VPGANERCQLGAAEAFFATLTLKARASLAVEQWKCTLEDREIICAGLTVSVDEADRRAQLVDEVKIHFLRE
jgi:hypothetical protein